MSQGVNEEKSWNTVQQLANKCYKKWVATQPRDEKAKTWGQAEFSAAKKGLNGGSSLSHQAQNGGDRLSKTLGSFRDSDRERRKLKSRFRDLDSVKPSYTEKDLLDDRIVKDELMPKFEMFGLGKILRVSDYCC